MSLKILNCGWQSTSLLDKKYHDEKWGIPVHDDYVQFEYLMLEVLQCGLSWLIVLKKHEIFRKCFDNFDFNKVAHYTALDIERIMNFNGMIHSKAKILAIINNAKCFQQIRQEFGSFSKYLWAYSDNKTIRYKNHEKGRLPAKNGLSKIISYDLKRRGFKFLGPISVYSHLQACGIINDHNKNCPIFHKINAAYPTIVLDEDDEI